MLATQQQTMKAIVIDGFGGTEQLHLTSLKTPQPAPDEVQIQVAYTAVNPVDWKICSGLLASRLPHEFPLILGWDAAGVISAVGSQVKKFKVGDAVFAYCRKPIIQWGTYAEFVCFTAENVAYKPAKLTFAQAAAIPLAGLTAWQSLFDAASLKSGESVLIQAGAGGVGSLAIQFAKHAGAFIVTTAQECNHDYVKKLGANVAIDYRTHSVRDEINKAVPGGLDVVFDTVGGESLKESYSYLKPGGRLVSIVEQPDQALTLKYKINGLYVFVAPKGDELQHIADLLQKGKVVPIQIQEMPLEKAAEALEKNRERHIQGKIVLCVNEAL